MVQVGPNSHCHSYRSNDLCLLLFPSQQTLSTAFRESLSSLYNSLMQCGDIELNPGPTVEEMFAEIMKSQKSVADDINEIKENLRKTEGSIAALNARLGTVEEKLEKINVIEAKTLVCETTVVALERTIHTLKTKLDDLENRGRRNNIIIRGISEPDGENENSLLDTVQNTVFKDTLGITISGIERLHRLGKKLEGKTRPVILKLVDFREKMLILKNCHKLKNTSIKISEDFSKRVQNIRQCLWESAETERSRGERIKLRFDKMIISNVTYAWDEVRGERYRLSELSASSGR